MQRFILIEHAMRNLGGHYYTYATSVLDAAERAGFQPVLATHRDFTEFDAFPATWQVHALFPRRSQWLHTIADSQTKDKFFLAKWWQQWNESRRTHRRLRRTIEFADACAALFQRVALQEGDHVLVATASDLDFYALARYLRAHPSSRCATWHLQFHHAIFKGRDPDYAAQFESTAQLRTLFSEAHQSVTNHRIRFYCTTDELARQYSLLNVAKFESIPYVIHSIFHRRERAPTDGRLINGPLQIACLGQIRPEKGDSQLPAIIDALWDKTLQTGRGMLLLQSSDSDLRASLEEQVGALVDASSSSATHPLRFATFPLSLEQYAELVHTTDIGLLLYDSAIYFARCSGLLLEMLIAGVPVIVPAGCWLSEQIAGETQRHLEELETTLHTHRRLDHNQLKWQDASNTCELAVAAGEVSLLVGFEWHAPQGDGNFLRIELQQLDAAGDPLHAAVAIMGRGNHVGKLRALFAIKPNTAHIRIQWGLAWSTEKTIIDNVHCQCLTTRPPAGTVGLITHSLDELPEQLTDIMSNIEHYRRGAAAFGKALALKHSGDPTVQAILAG